jgi:glycosyltransferase involved in cell wall biosynthesis
MRILTICHEYPPVGGGGATACEILAETLALNGHEVDVLCAAMPGDAASELRRGVQLHRAVGWRRRRHYSTAAELATWIPPAHRLGRRLGRQAPYDVIHCHFIVPGGIVAAPLARRLGLPLVLTAHGSDVPGYNPDRFALTHRLIAPAWSHVVRAASAVTVASSHLAMLIGRVTDRRIEIIPNAFEPQLAPPLEGRADRMLVATRLVERKGVQSLLAAMAGAPIGPELVIAGDGPCRGPLEDLARQLGLAARFLGFVPRGELSRHYAAARVFVFPSTEENFPMVLLEAMAHGCAVVTTSAPGCVEVVGDAALIVPPGDVGALRAALLRLANEPGLAVDLARRGIERVRRFSPAAVAGEFERLFEGLTTCRR